MKRSERLAKEGKVEVYCLGGFSIAKVIENCNAIKNLRYIATDFDCLYDGKEVSADIYESNNLEDLGEWYAVINKA